MLVLATRMDGLRTTSGLRPVGRLSGFLIEPDKAFVRYIVLRSERMGADIAAPAASFGAPDLVEHQIPICSSERKIKESARLDLVRKCSRECEIALHQTLHWAPYWPAQDARRTRRLYRLEGIIGFKTRVCGLPAGSLETAVINTEDWSLPLATLARQVRIREPAK